MDVADPVIAIVDDDEFVRRALRRLIGMLSYRPVAFSSGEDFLASLAYMVPACVLLDLHMPGLNGLEVLKEMRSRSFNVPTIIISGNGRPEFRTLCIRAGAIDYLQKPLSPTILDATIQQALARRNGSTPPSN